MFRKKLIITLASTLFIVCTIVTSFAFVNHSAHARCSSSDNAACHVVPTPTPAPPHTSEPYCAPTIAYGSTGDWVQQLQSALDVAENANLKIDGQFGPLTLAAVKKWQRHVFPHTPREWNGIVGPHTWNSIGWCYATN